MCFTASENGCAKKKMFLTREMSFLKNIKGVQYSLREILFLEIMSLYERNIYFYWRKDIFGNKCIHYCSKEPQ